MLTRKRTLVAALVAAFALVTLFASTATSSTGPQVPPYVIDHVTMQPTLIGTETFEVYDSNGNYAGTVPASQLFSAPSGTGTRIGTDIPTTTTDAQ